MVTYLFINAFKQVISAGNTRLPGYVLAIALICLVHLSLQAQTNDPEGPLPTIDVRDARLKQLNRLQTVQPNQQKALQDLKGIMPDVQIEWDQYTGNVKSMYSTKRFLTNPSVESPTSVARQFVLSNERIFGLQEKDLSNLKQTRDAVMNRSGIRRLLLQQEYRGIPVYGSNLRVNLSKRGELINCSSDIIPNLEETIQGRSPRIRSDRAVTEAAASIGVKPTSPLQLKKGPDGATQKSVYDKGLDLADDVMVQLYYWPLNRTEVRLVWEVYMGARNSDYIYQLFVDAENGQVIYRTSISHSIIAPPNWRVFTSDSPTPMSPGTATPDGTQPAAVVRKVVTTNGDPVASPSGWIPAAGTTTTGNNVDAFIDGNNDGTPDVARPTSATQNFDFPLDFTQPPTNADNQRSVVVNAFYWANWYHDRLYALGFDEMAGNFQTDNFGRGGVGSDPVIIRSQSGVNNSTFATPPDGSPGIWRAFIFDGPNPDRDAGFDQEIGLHELTHGLSNRLAGGLAALQSRAMGEGWSDFYALALLAEPTDNINGHWAMGAYSVFELAFADPGWNDNYYFGIRRYPYSTDLNKSPLTFADTDPAQFNADPSIPTSPWLVGTGASGVHNAGEIWCNSLMECRANLINFYGFATGNELMLQLVTDGLALLPNNTPTYIVARDAILQADMNATGGANQCLLWKGFAKRGLGPGAQALNASTFSGVVEDFYTPLQTPTAVVSSPSCPGSCDASINLSITGGESPLSYQWNNGATTQDINGLCAGNYTVIVTDKLGCNEGKSFTVPNGVDITPPVIACPANITVTCDTTTTGTGVATATDNCDPNPDLSYTDQHISGDCEWACELERTWKATDMWANSSTCVQKIEKNTLPLILQALSADLDGDGNIDTLVMGTAQTTLTIGPESAACVLEWIPGSSGSPTALKRGAQRVGIDCKPGTNAVDSKGRLTNPLLAEAIKLAIIIRLDPTIGEKPLTDFGCTIHPVVLQTMRDVPKVKDFMQVVQIALGNIVLVSHLPKLHAALSCINDSLDICK